jgi:cell division septum initiation protein DivIVA
VAEPISALVKALDQVAEQIGTLNERLRQLEAERERLKRAIRAADATAHDPKDEAPEKIRDAVEIVRRAAGPTGIATVAEAMGISARAANNLLLRAKQMGLIDSKSRGRYVPAAPASDDSKVSSVTAGSVDERATSSNVDGS